ncbi:hypothetical protein PI91_12565 [Enterobacter sp. FB]|uniref:hypothetical protein n=1 Tax=Enterobacter sp. FB TaxID=1571816 RepID=UPI000574590F|nr:hypothetical protein [Enterobacter sp. FB]KHO34827.1 hypothetical protein PI91_12565 [Enterobacter sp. FB]OIR49502.1 hypothetical protein BH716_12730 [Lelliottia nimipressuralis]
MKEFKGTTGKWRVNGKYIDSTQPDGMVQEVAWLGDVGYGDRMANANLIAAAPDLLEALQELVFLYEHDEGCRELTEYKRAKAAISKALGEE